MPPVSPSPERLSTKPFSFYPPIRNIEHNEWRYRRETWAEILVANAKTELEIWIPRRFLGEVSSIEEPVMIVGLLKELEYTGGLVWPRDKRVLEMPRAPAPVGRSVEGSSEPSTATAASSGAERRIGRFIAAALIAGILLTFIVVNIVSRRDTNIVFLGREQVSLGLGRRDDYFAIVRRLGTPTADRWRSEQGAVQYRVLSYPGRSLSIILMGSDRKDAHYIGALDKNWKVVDSVELPKGGGNTASMLRALPRF